MVSPENGDTGVYRAGPESSQCLPLKRGNVSFLSFGHVNPSAGVPGAVRVFIRCDAYQCIIGFVAGL
jgi:hypothetical protein